MSTIMMEVDRELVDLLHNLGRPEDKLKEYLVLELYRRREISSGKAAELLGMQKFEFVRYASRVGIPYLDMDQQELEDEIKAARGKHD
jgi:predicted HTH domain antitoxin